MSENKKGGLLHASERDGVEYRKAPLLQLIAGMSGSGTMIVLYLILGFATLIAPEGYGIPTAVAGIILTVTRWADGLSDAVVAAIYEKFNQKKGKIRIMMLIGWLIAVLASNLMYNWAAGVFDGVWGIVVFVIIYLLFDIGYTTFTTSSGTIAIVITNDPTQRPMTSMLNTIFSYTVPLICTNLITFVILPKYDMLYNIDMLSETMIWFSAISFVFVLTCCWGVRKIDVQETFAKLPKENQEAENKVSLKEMWSVIKDNRNVQMYMLTTISDRFAQQTMSQSVVSNLLGGVLIGSYAATTTANNFSQIIGLVFAFLGGVLIAKYGAKKITTQWSWLNILAAAATVAMFVILCVTSGSVDGMKQLSVVGLPFVIYVILNIFKTGANMVLTTAGGAMKADLVDYEYERSGNYFPAVLTGVYSFVDKIVTSFASALAMVCIALVGYTTTVPQLGDKATWPIFWIAMFLNFGLAVIGWLCNVIAMKFYTLDRERMIQVQKTLNERKEAVKAAAEKQ